MSVPSKLALFIAGAMSFAAMADDGRERSSPENVVDFSQLTFHTELGHEVDVANLKFTKGSLHTNLPLPDKRLRFAKRVRFELPIETNAEAIVASYRIRLGDGVSHDVMIEGSTGLVLFYFQVVAKKGGGEEIETVTADEWHSIKICHSRDGYSGEVNGQTLATSQRNSRAPLRPITLQFDTVRDESRSVAIEQLSLSTRR